MVILVDAAGIRNPTGGYEVIPAGAIGFFSGIAVLEERWSIGDWARETVEIYVPNSTLPGRVRYLSPFVSLMGVEGRHDPDKPGWIVDGFSADYIVSGAYNGIKITAQVAFKENCRIMSLGYQVLVFCVD